MDIDIPVETVSKDAFCYVQRSEFRAIVRHMERPLFGGLLRMGSISRPLTIPEVEGSRTVKNRFDSEGEYSNEPVKDSWQYYERFLNISVKRHTHLFDHGPLVATTLNPTPLKFFAVTSFARSMTQY